MKIAIICLAAVVLFLAIVSFGFTPQKRGLSESHRNTFASNGRPALAIVVDNIFGLHDSGWCTISPDSRVSLEGSARLWYARYVKGNTVVLVALAEAEDPWRWPHGNGTVLQYFREKTRIVKEQTLYESTYVISADKDPFALIQGRTIVRRMVLPRDFRKVQVIVEYREPLPESGNGLAPEDNIAFLSELERKAEDAYAILFRESGDEIPKNIVTLQKAPQNISRSLIARWTGEVLRIGKD